MSIVCKHCKNAVIVPDGIEPDWEVVLLGHLIMQGHVFQLTDESKKMLEDF